MIGAHVATVKLIRFVTDNASGFSLGVDPSPSMSQSPAITNCATARCHRTLLSATELINISGSGQTRIIVDSGQFGVLQPSGAASATGSFHSTDELLEK